MLIHVALISDQTIPNLIPALMERPDRVYLVATDAMLRKGMQQRLEVILDKHGIRTETVIGAPDAGLATIIEFAGQVITRIQQSDPAAQIVLNATGGKKLMALGFVEVFRHHATRIVYTDTEHRQIECLPAGGKASADPIPMRDVLNVETYLAAQGFGIECARSDDAKWCAEADTRRAACEFLAERIAERDVQNLIGALNALAQQALDKKRLVLVEARQTLSDDPRDPWPEILGRLQNFGLLRSHGGNIEFTNVSSARFLNGDWLEEYAWHVAGDAKPFDVRVGVKGQWNDARSARNEFDVLATHVNELLFIECKTLRHGREEAKDADLLYKADSLGHDVRGLFGTTWLITARAPESEMRGRARQQGVTLLGPAEIAGLGGQIRNWMAGVVRRR